MKPAREKSGGRKEAENEKNFVALGISFSSNNIGWRFAVLYGLLWGNRNISVP